MPEPTRSETDNPNQHVTLATALGNLRDHFAPISLSAGLPVGAEKIAPGEAFVDRRSPLPLDNALVQQTKDQIRAIVDSITLLANSPIEPTEFVAASLSKILQAMGAKGVGLWERLQDESWLLVGHVDLPDSLIAGNPSSAQAFGLHEAISSIGNCAGNSAVQSTFDQLDLLQANIEALEATDTTTDAIDETKQKLTRPSPAHTLILNAVAAERQPILIPPNHVSLSRDRPTNPTSDLLILAPLTVPKEQATYWLQVVQAPSGGPSSQRGYLRFVAQMADLLSDYYRSHRLRIFERDRMCLKIAERTMFDLAEQPDLRVGLARLMNTLREHAKSEHAVLLRRSSRFRGWQVEAAAGLVQVDRRADGISQIERTAPWIQTNLPANSVRSIANLLGTAEQRDSELSIWVNTFAVTEFAWLKPLMSKSSLTSSQPQHDVAILLTWSGFDKPPANCREQCNLIARLGMSALRVPWWKQAMAVSHNQPSGLRTWLNPANWTRSLQWLGGLAALTILALIPVPIRLHATAVLVPTVQQHVYAPVDCLVEEVLVHHGQSVKTGEPLLRLNSASLTSEYDQTIAQHLRNAQRLKDIEARLLREKTLSPMQRDELEGEREAIEGTQRIEQQMLDGLKLQMESLLIVAGIDGIVATWNIKENLRDRPLRVGQWLLSLHDADSDWMLEAALPEQDGQEFRVAMQTQTESPVATLSAAPQYAIPLKYRSEAGRVDRAGAFDRNSSSTSNASASVIRMRFDVDRTNLPTTEITSGASARVSIPSGRGPLIWALSKDFVRKTWAQIKMWI
ncbi:MAG: biotin/lipoyl-binding protein [Pirellula sp.]